MVLPFLIPLGVALAKEFVPDLIGELVGPGAEKVAEKLVGVATELTGEQDPEKILVAMRADKEMAAKLSIQMSEERIAMAEADQKDRASARRMASKGGILTAAPVAVSVISTIGFFGAVAVVLVVNVPDGSKEVVFTLLVYLCAVG